MDRQLGWHLADPVQRAATTSRATASAALNPTTGAVLWSDTSGSVGLHWQSPIVAGGSLYYADGGGHLRAFNLSGSITRISGTDRYEVSAAGVSRRPPAGAPVAYVASWAPTTPTHCRDRRWRVATAAPCFLRDPMRSPPRSRPSCNRLHPARSSSPWGDRLGERTRRSPRSTDTRPGPSPASGGSRPVRGERGDLRQLPVGRRGPAYVTTGENFPDALSATPLAAGTGGGPILLTAHDVIPPSVATALQRLHSASPPPRLAR